jgi:hypothetical protein
MINYVAQTQGEKIGNKIVSITNLNPPFSVDEKREVKLQIEAKLYDVFYKYMSCKP